MLKFLTHHKSSIIGLISAILPYLMSRGYIGLEEMQVITSILAVFGVGINIALPRK